MKKIISVLMVTALLWQGNVYASSGTLRQVPLGERDRATNITHRVNGILTSLEASSNRANSLFDNLGYFFNMWIDNVGDPVHFSNLQLSTMDIEREVLEFWAKTYGLAPDEKIFGGYVAFDQSKADLYGLFIARDRFNKDAVVYYCDTDRSGSISECLNVLHIGEIKRRRIKVSNGQIDYDHLRDQLENDRDRSIIIVLNGTPAASDDLQRVNEILVRKGIPKSRVHIHYRLAASGGNKFLVDSSETINFFRGLDSISLPVGEAVNAPLPGAVVLTRRDYVKRVMGPTSEVEYVLLDDTTIAGSRNGHIPLMLWVAMKMTDDQGEVPRRAMEYPDEVKARLAIAEFILSDLRERSLGYNINLTRDFTQVVRAAQSVVSSQDVADLERELVAFFARHYKIPEDEAFGMISCGGSWGNLLGLFIGRRRMPFHSKLYFCAESHYSVGKMSRVLDIPLEEIPALPNGEIDYERLEAVLDPEVPAILNLNIGTTLKGAIDKLDRVVEILERKGVTQYYIHCDCALSGSMLPFIADPNVPEISFAKGADSIAISGHKFPGVTMPCGIFLTRKEYVTPGIERMAQRLLASPSGLPTVFLWYAVMTMGEDGFRRETLACIDTALYAYTRLQEAGLPSGVNDFATTVCFPRPSIELVRERQLSPFAPLAHLVTGQHVTSQKIDAFVRNMQAEMRRGSLDKLDTHAQAVLASMQPARTYVDQYYDREVHEAAQQEDAHRQVRSDPMVAQHINAIARKFGVSEAEVEILSVPFDVPGSRMLGVRRGEANYVYHIPSKNCVMRIFFIPALGLVDKITTFRDRLFPEGPASNPGLAMIWEVGDIGFTNADAERERNYTYVIMQYIEGEPLPSALDQRPDLTLAFLKDVMTQIFECNRRLIFSSDCGPQQFKVATSPEGHQVVFFDYIDGSVCMDADSPISQKLAPSLATTQIEALEVLAHDILEGIRDVIGNDDKRALSNAFEKLRDPIIQLNGPWIEHIYGSEIFPTLDDLIKKYGSTLASRAQPVTEIDDAAQAARLSGI